MIRQDRSMGLHSQVCCWEESSTSPAAKLLLPCFDELVHLGASLFPLSLISPGWRPSRGPRGRLRRARKPIRATPLQHQSRPSSPERTLGPTITRQSCPSQPWLRIRPALSQCICHSRTHTQGGPDTRLTISSNKAWLLVIGNAQSAGALSTGKSHHPTFSRFLQCRRSGPASSSLDSRRSFCWTRQLNAPLDLYPTET
jgi:hypothetical protein